MKQTFHIFLTLILLNFTSGCSDIGDKENSMFGKIYRDEKEIEELKGYEDMGGSVIFSSEDDNGDYKFGISHLQKNGNHIFILEEFLESNEKGKVKYKILDTINAGTVKMNQYLTYGNCREYKESDEELIALVTTDDEDDRYDDKIVKAWSIDIKKGTINRINKTEGISCLKIEGSGDEDVDYDVDTVAVNETEIAETKLDSTETEKIDSTNTNE